jgi:hypothetical protein
MGLLRKAWRYLCVFGLRATLVRTVQKIGELAGVRAVVPPAQQLSAADLLVGLSRDLGRSPDDHPHADIVVPIFNGLGMAQRCIESVLRNSSKSHPIWLVSMARRSAMSPSNTSRTT